MSVLTRLVSPFSSLQAKPSNKASSKAASAKKPAAPKSPRATPAKKASGTAASKEVKAAKKYDLPGQKKDTPGELDVLRMFYESAWIEDPYNEMAARWCLTYGLLPRNLAEALVDKGFVVRRAATERGGGGGEGAERRKRSERGTVLLRCGLAAPVIVPLLSRPS